MALGGGGGGVSYAQAAAAHAGRSSATSGGGMSGRPREGMPTCTLVDGQSRSNVKYGNGEDAKERKSTAYEAALASARLSAFDARTGNVRCVPCGKAFGSYKSLAVHLLAKHGGSNTLEAKFLNVNAAPTALISTSSTGGGSVGKEGGGRTSGAGVRKTQRERLQESSLLDFDALIRKGKDNKAHETATTSARGLGAGSGGGHRLNAHAKTIVGNGTAKVKHFKGRLVETTTVATTPSDGRDAGHTTTTTTTVEVQKKKKRPSILKRLIVNERKTKEYQNAIALVRKLEAEKTAKADVAAWHNANVTLVEKLLEVVLLRWSATPLAAIASQEANEHEDRRAEDTVVDALLSRLDAHLARVGAEKRGSADAESTAIPTPSVVDACGVELPLVTEDEVLCIDLRIARDVLREKQRDSVRLYDVADRKLQEAERVQAALEEEYVKKEKEKEEKREQCVPVETVKDSNANGDGDDGHRELDPDALQHQPPRAEAHVTSSESCTSDATALPAVSEVETADGLYTQEAHDGSDDEMRHWEMISSCDTKPCVDGTEVAHGDTSAIDIDADAVVPCTVAEDDPTSDDPSGQDIVQPVCPDASMEGARMQAIVDTLMPSYSRAASNQTHCLLCPSCCTSAMDYLRHVTGAKHRKAVQKVALAMFSRETGLVSTVHGASDVTFSRVQTMSAVSSTDPVPRDGMRYTGKMGDYAPYVFQTISPLLNEKVTELIGLLVKWQRRVKEREPQNIKRKMRIVIGMREVGKCSKLGKLKCLIVAPNIEQMEAKGSLDDRIKTMLDAARVASSAATSSSSSMMRQKTDVIFALTRQKLGKAVDAVAIAASAAAAASGSAGSVDVRRHHNSRPTKISVLGILDYGGAEREYKEVMRLVEEGRREFAERLGERVYDTHETTVEKTVTATTNSGTCADEAASSLVTDEDDDDFHIILSKSPSSTEGVNLASMVPTPKMKLRADAPIFIPLACNR